MHLPIQAKVARGLAIAATLTLAATGSAAAAGPGYGGGGAPPVVTPVGFSSVVTARTVTAKGGSFRVKYAHGAIRVDVPKNATKHPIQIAITKGNTGTVKSSLSASLQHYRIVSSFGVQVRNGSNATSTSRTVTITLSAHDIKKGDVVLVYSPATGKFTALRGATVRNGKVTIHLKSGESLAVAAPPGKR
jgi:hypothetical protein